MYVAVANIFASKCYRPHAYPCMCMCCACPPCGRARGLLQSVRLSEPVFSHRMHAGSAVCLKGSQLSAATCRPGDNAWLLLTKAAAQLRFVA